MSSARLYGIKLGTLIYRGSSMMQTNSLAKAALVEPRTRTRFAYLPQPRAYLKFIDAEGERALSECV